MSSSVVVLYPSTLESLSIQIRTNDDPTGTAPFFSFGAATVPGTWVMGSWLGSFDAPYSTALTPTIGGTLAGLTIAADTTYTLWIKVTLGGEVAVWPVGTVKAR